MEHTAQHEEAFLFISLLICMQLISCSFSLKYNVSHSLALINLYSIRLFLCYALAFLLQFFSRRMHSIIRFVFLWHFFLCCDRACLYQCRWSFEITISHKTTRCQWQSNNRAKKTKMDLSSYVQKQQRKLEESEAIESIKWEAIFHENLRYRRVVSSINFKLYAFLITKRDDSQETNDNRLERITISL